MLRKPADILYTIATFDQEDLKNCVASRLLLSHSICCILRKASENQPDERAGNWFPATLKQTSLFFLTQLIFTHLT